MKKQCVGSKKAKPKCAAESKDPQSVAAKVINYLILINYYHYIGRRLWEKYVIKKLKK